MDARIFYPDIPTKINTGLIVTELASYNTNTACGVTVRSPAPVLALCRRLIEAGHDPRSRLEAYRGSTLCLSVRSIGEAAALQIGGDGVGFRPACKPGGRALVVPIASEGTQ